MNKGQLLEMAKKFPWQELLLVGLLILLDLSIHPLTAGPDRLVHDPAVNRILDPNYLPGDWYTQMAVKSGVYTFFAQLVGAYRFLHLPEEFWRLFIYLIGLGVLYYSLIRIAGLFSKSLLVIPVVVLLHNLMITGDNQPVWVYGPFIQILGGLAPLSVGIAVSFLALGFLLRGFEMVAFFLLGLATLIHVSNSFIVFTLLFLVWLAVVIVDSRPLNKQKWLDIGAKSGVGLMVYLVAGGWFALYVATRGSIAQEFATEKFIWSWVYLRAPYLALPLVTEYWWIRLFAHAAAIVGGWVILRRNVAPAMRRALDIVALVGLGSVGYFFLFYLFAFIWPWLPGFQFYSLRVVYFAYFAAYLFTALSLVVIGREFFARLFKKLGSPGKLLTSAGVLLVAVAFLYLLSAKLGDTFRQPTVHNLKASWWRLTDTIENRSGALQHATFQYLYTNPEPFLAPPNWRTSVYYLPSIVSFKSFGFTKEGLPQWYVRLNDISRGELEQIYQTQRQAGQFRPVELDWGKLYPMLTQEDIVALSRKYNFKLIVTYRSVEYPFDLVAQDSDYRLYRLPQ